MDIKGLTKSVNSELLRFKSTTKPTDRIANLVLERLSAKFEQPKSASRSERRNTAWDVWLLTDETLPQTGILGPHWAEARLWCHRVLRNYSVGPLTFTNGSSYEPLGESTSVASKLTTKWTITDDCFDLFAELSYRCRGLKHTVKKRFTSYCTTNSYNETALNRELWRHYGNQTDGAFQIFKFKLFCIVEFVYGNRFSTVPKNNLKDRPICLEPLCNMLVQRAVGIGIRSCLKNNVGIDLDHLADEHRNRISTQCATIDMTNCSDTISLRLVKYLLPTRVYKHVIASRSDMTLGLDDQYYVVNKVSSMGNGFTFDLMSLILTAVARSFDPLATVFGDDIICRNDVADGLIEALTAAGFQPNMNKTLIRSDYRESCGAHYIDGAGYITSFDFHWCVSLHDVIVTLNKVAILATIYGGPYESLRARLWSLVPPVLLGVAVQQPVHDASKPPDFALDSYVRYGGPKMIKPSPHTRKVISRFCRNTCKPIKDLSVGLCVTAVNRFLPYRTLRSSQWNVFFQHLHTTTCSAIRVRTMEKTSLVARVGLELVGRVNALIQ